MKSQKQTKIEVKKLIEFLSKNDKCQIEKLSKILKHFGPFISVKEIFEFAFLIKDEELYFELMQVCDFILSKKLAGIGILKLKINSIIKLRLSKYIDPINEDFLKLTNNDLDSYIFLGQIYSQNNYYEVSLNLIKNGIKKFPKSKRLKDIVFPIIKKSLADNKSDKLKLIKNSFEILGFDEDIFDPRVPKNKEFKFLYMILYKEFMKNMSDSDEINKLEIVLKKSYDNDLDVLLLISLRYRQLGLIDKSLNFINEMIDKFDSEIKLYEIKYQLLFIIEDYKNCLKVASKVFKLSPQLSINLYIKALNADKQYQKISYISDLMPFILEDEKVLNYIQSAKTHLKLYEKLGTSHLLTN